MPFYLLYFLIVEGIVFYFLLFYRSIVLKIPCKADEFCLFIGLPEEIKNIACFRCPV